MKHKLFVSKNHHLELVVNGDLSGQELQLMLDRFESYAREQKANGQSANIIVEATKLGRATPENRKEALRRLQALEINKMAVYGSHNPYAKYVTHFAAKALKLPSMRFFDSRQQAEDWIEADD